MTKIKTHRICAGYYETTNTTPVAYVSKSMDFENTWQISYGDVVGKWGSKKECLQLIESIDYSIREGIDEIVPEYKITINRK